jgi:nucleotide-binding universal stress UspA family protein
MTKTYRIVVGIDGSETGERALRWAVHEAASRGGTVQAVAAFTFDGVDASNLHNRDEQQKMIEDMLCAQVAAALDDDPRVAVTTRVAFGSPADVLPDCSRHANLLVLGSHGHGRLYHAVIGSTADACLRHAVCPLVVVPAPNPDRSVDPAAEVTGLPAAIL